jgi:hypothetical protein
MEAVRVFLLALFGPLALVFWGVFIWSLVKDRRMRNRGETPTKVQVEATSWAAAIALGLSAFAALGLLL